MSGLKDNFKITATDSNGVTRVYEHTYNAGSILGGVSGGLMGPSASITATVDTLDASGKPTGTGAQTVYKDKVKMYSDQTMVIPAGVEPPKTTPVAVTLTPLAPITAPATPVTPAAAPSAPAATPAPVTPAAPAQPASKPALATAEVDQAVQQLNRYDNYLNKKSAYLTSNDIPDYVGTINKVAASVSATSASFKQAKEDCDWLGTQGIKYKWNGKQCVTA